MGEPLHVLAQPLGIEALEGLHDPGMELALLFPQQRVVGHPARQCVLEDVVRLLEQAGVIDELGRPETVQGVSEIVLGHRGDGLEQDDRHILSDGRRGLEQALVDGREPVDARGQNCLDGGGHPERLEGLGKAIASPLPDEDAVLDHYPDALFEEEGIPPCLLDQQQLEGGQAVIVSEHEAEKLVRVLGRQWEDTELRVVALAGPRVPIFLPVVDEEQHPRGGEALDQAIEERLGLGVNPVQVLEDDAQRLHLALPQQEEPHGVQCPLPPLARIQGLPLRILDRHVEEREEGGDNRGQLLVERLHLSDDLVADLLLVGAVVHLEVRAQQIDDRSVGRRLAVGKRARLQDSPAGHSFRTGELVEEP